MRDGQGHLTTPPLLIVIVILLCVPMCQSRPSVERLATRWAVASLGGQLVEPGHVAADGRGVHPQPSGYLALCAAPHQKLDHLAPPKGRSQLSQAIVVAPASRSRVGHAVRHVGGPSGCVHLCSALRCTLMSLEF